MARGLLILKHRCLDTFAFNGGGLWSGNFFVGETAALNIGDGITNIAATVDDIWNLLIKHSTQ